MIVSAENLVLAAPGPLNTPIFGWRSIATAGDFDTNSEDPAHPITNLANPSTTLFWRAAEDGSPAGAPTFDVYITIRNLDGLIDYLAIAAHNLGSGENIVSVEVSEGGSPEVWTEIIGETVPKNDEPIIFRFPPQMASAIRLRIQPGVLVPQIAVMYAGKLLVCERGTSSDFVPINLGRRTKILTGRSETGHFLGRYILSESRETAFALERLRASWYRNTFDPFLKWAQDMPFFFAHQPQTEPEDVGFCWLTNDPEPTFHFDTGTVAITMQLTGIAV